MHLHLLHHAYYNFRVMHLYDIALASRRWRDHVDPDVVADCLDGLGLAQLVDDVRAWIHVLFDDEFGLPRCARSARDALVAEHVFRYGSLPDFAGVRYATSVSELLSMLPHEMRRFGFRMSDRKVRAPMAWSSP